MEQFEIRTNCVNSGYLRGALSYPEVAEEVGGDLVVFSDFLSNSYRLRGSNFENEMNWLRSETDFIAFHSRVFVTIDVASETGNEGRVRFLLTMGIKFKTIYVKENRERPTNGYGPGR